MVTVVAAVLAGRIATSPIAAPSEPQAQAAELSAPPSAAVRGAGAGALEGTTSSPSLPADFPSAELAEPLNTQLLAQLLLEFDTSLPLALDGGSLVLMASSLRQGSLALPLPPAVILDRMAQAAQEQRLYTVYQVQTGDTVIGITRRFGLSTDTLLWNNPHLTDDPDYLKLGQELVVPTTDGIVYYTKLGDTLHKIASLYQVDVEKVLAFKANKLSSADDLKESIELLLPGARPPAPLVESVAVASAPASRPADDSPILTPAAASKPNYPGSLTVGATVEVLGPGCLNARPAPGSPASNGCLAEGFVATIADGPTYANGHWWWLLKGQGWSVDEYLRPYKGPTSAPASPASSSGFIWPVSGRISDGFGVPRGGNSYHSGIDIDAFGRSRVPVAAAAAGRVVFVAQLSYGYGFHVIIDHGNGFETLYAHLSSIAVTLGQRVAQGEIIGRTGNTGLSFGEHLHFEIRKGGSPTNPLNYLP